MEHSNNTDNTCKICKQKFFPYKTLSDHYKHKHLHGNGLKNSKRKSKWKYGKHKCNSCYKRFAQKQSLDTHTSVVHPESLTTIKNKTVKKQTSIQPLLLNEPHDNIPHMPSSHPHQKANPFLAFNSKFRCTGCSKIFQVPSKLIEHIKKQPLSVKHNWKIYKETISNLNHITICEKCDTIFYTPKNFIEHIKTDHNSEDLAKHLAYALRLANRN